MHAVSRSHTPGSSLAKTLFVIAASFFAATLPAHAQKKNSHQPVFWPGNLLVSRSVYDNNPDNVQVGEILPPNCAQTQGGCGASTGAPYNGSYPLVWNDDSYDGSFGITSKIYLDQMLTIGFVLNSLEVPNSSERGIGRTSDQLVTSFSSKSEMALNLSNDARYVTFSGYVSPIDALDVSNSNTPGAVDPTNPVGENVYRAIAQVDALATSSSPRPMLTAETTDERRS